MNLSEKILKLRKENGMSQEELAEKLNVSRQSISRWENGSAQPDASNLSQLTKIFKVTADYLINDEYENDTDVPIIKNIEMQAKNKMAKILGVCVSLFGLMGNLVIYILSRFTQVTVPYITYDDAGKKWYNWSSDVMGYSYKYFVEQFNLEFLVFLFWLLAAVGMFIAFANKQKVKAFAVKVAEKIKKLNFRGGM